MCINYEYHPDQLLGRQAHINDCGIRRSSTIVRVTEVEGKAGKVASVTVKVGRDGEQTLEVGRWHFHGLDWFRGSCNNDKFFTFDPQPLPEKKEDVQAEERPPLHVVEGSAA